MSHLRVDNSNNDYVSLLSTTKLGVNSYNSATVTLILFFSDALLFLSSQIKATVSCKVGGSFYF